jgi:peptide/nickel transport system permease protein
VQPRWWKQFARNRLALAAMAVIVAYALAALAAPWLAPHDPMATSLQNLQAPGGEHWLGTDQLGRDIFSRLLYGARISLRVAGISVGLALMAGTIIGLLAGYLGRWVDSVLGRTTDVMLALPEIVLALVVLAVLGPGFFNISLAIAIVYTPIFARVCRGAVVRVASEPYVEAARALGLSPVRIMLRHVLPNASGPLIVQATLSLAFAMLAEAALSFLGLSGESDVPSWGLMLRQGKDYMELAWWLAVFPGIAITLAVFSFNALGDGLRDALDPRTRMR